MGNRIGFKELTIVEAIVCLAILIGLVLSIGKCS